VPLDLLQATLLLFLIPFQLLMTNTLRPKILYRATGYRETEHKIAPSRASVPAPQTYVPARPIPMLYPHEVAHKAGSNEPWLSQVHYAVDGGKARIILGVLLTPSEVTENRPMLELLWRARFRWQLPLRQVTGDGKYGTAENNRGR
jgi:hypothetical protein